MEVNVSATSVSEFEKEEFLKGFRSSSGKARAPRGETFRAEEEWMQSSIDLYEFTLAHFGDYGGERQKTNISRPWFARPISGPAIKIDRFPENCHRVPTQA